MDKGTATVLSDLPFLWLIGQVISTEKSKGEKKVRKPTYFFSLWVGEN